MIATVGANIVANTKYGSIDHSVTVPVSIRCPLLGPELESRVALYRIRSIATKSQ